MSLHRDIERCAIDRHPSVGVGGGLVGVVHFVCPTPGWNLYIRLGGIIMVRKETRDCATGSMDAGRHADGGICDVVFSKVKLGG